MKARRQRTLVEELRSVNPKLAAYVFDGMRWAGSKANIELDAESWLLITNQGYEVPLPEDEVRGIARDASTNGR